MNGSTFPPITIFLVFCCWQFVFKLLRRGTETIYASVHTIEVHSMQQHTTANFTLENEMKYFTFVIHIWIKNELYFFVESSLYEAIELFGTDFA